MLSTCKRHQRFSLRSVIQRPGQSSQSHTSCSSEAYAGSTSRNHFAVRSNSLPRRRGSGDNRSSKASRLLVGCNAVSVITLELHDATHRLTRPPPSPVAIPGAFPLGVSLKQEKLPRLRGLPCRCRQLATPRFDRREVCKWTKSVLA